MENKKVKGLNFNKFLCYLNLASKHCFSPFYRARGRDGLVLVLQFIHWLFAISPDTVSNNIYITAVCLYDGDLNNSQQVQAN